MDYYALAYKFAEEGHANQTDKAGLPYFGHVLRVVERVRRALERLPPGHLTQEQTTAILCAAVLHDVVEDEEITGKTYAMLESLGLPEEVLVMVRRLDKRFKIGTYVNNIELIAMEGNIGVIAIKKSDTEDNNDPDRIAALPESERSITNRYNRTGAILNAAFEEYVRDRS